MEADIQSIIEQSEALQMNYQLLTSIKSVGFITAVYMIAYTDNFQKFVNSRQFSFYAGVVPFEHSSGTSIRGKSRVSHYVGKKAKRLLNVAASVAIQHNGKLKQYYQRRIKEGKSKMSTINMIRNKLVDRMFAVVKRQTPYQEIVNIAA